MSVKVVYLHGVGTGDLDASWLEGLNEGLVRGGYAPVDRDDVCAPLYSPLLSVKGAGAKLPPSTYTMTDDGASRLQFERRQADVLRKMAIDPDVLAFGLGRLPGGMLSAVQNGAVGLGPAVLGQVKRYVADENLRGAVLHHILACMPKSGEIILIAHSLGSVIGIDLLGRLPKSIHVRRFITIGSPASARVFNANSDRLLDRFPYARVDDWSNFFGTSDPVTAGRGLATAFPAARDFKVSTYKHASKSYLSHPAIAGLVADVLYPKVDTRIVGRGLTVQMTADEANTLLLLHYAHAVRRRIKDPKVAERYAGALSVNQDNLAADWQQKVTLENRSPSPELELLVAGKLPPLPHCWDFVEAVPALLTFALTNLVEPYDIEVGSAQIDALDEIAAEMGFLPATGTKIGKALQTVEASVVGKRGKPWGRVLTAAVGLGLVALGPIGLVAAAPAAAFGGAAIVGGLAAFGPGGMVGGIAMVGGLAGAGAALAAAAALPAGAKTSVVDTTRLTIRLMAQLAYQRLDIPVDRGLWYLMADAENDLSAEISRLKVYSDADSSDVKELEDRRTLIVKLMSCMIENGLAHVIVEPDEEDIFVRS